jgi:hypothetical protein
MATVSAYFPPDSPFLKLIRERAAAEHDGKIAAYARAALERDISGAESAPSPLAPDVIEALTRILCGHARALRMRTALAEQDQVIALTNLLEDHLARLESQRRTLTTYPQTQDDGPAAMAAEAPAVLLPVHPPKKTLARKIAPPGAA